MNRWLQRQDFLGGLRKLLNQADMGWTLAGLLALTLVAWVVVGAAVFLRTNDPKLATIIGAAAAVGPLLYVRFKRNQRFEKFEQGLPRALDLY